MLTPSIFSAFKKLLSLLTREEKIKWACIAGFALCTSLLEVLTATMLVVFSQVLIQPEIGQKYINYIGIEGHFTPGKIEKILNYNELHVKKHQSL